MVVSAVHTPGDGAARSGEGSAGCEAWVVERPEAGGALGVAKGGRRGSQALSTLSAWSRFAVQWRARARQRSSPTSCLYHLILPSTYRLPLQSKRGSSPRYSPRLSLCGDLVHP